LSGIDPKDILEQVELEGDSLRASAAQASREMFIEAAAGLARAEGMLLPDPGKTTPGKQMTLELFLSGGRPLMKVKGELRSPPDLPAGTLLFQFLEPDDAARRLLGAMLAAQSRAKKRGRKTQGRSVHALSDMARRAMAHPAFLKSMEAALNRMVVRESDGSRVKTKPTPKSKEEGPIIGIDLGTTNSCCAMVKKKGERPFVIPSQRGHNTIPSVVAIDPLGEVKVGHAAKSQMEMNPDRTIYGSKRLVGRPFDSPMVRQVSDRFHYEIVAGSDGLAAVRIGDRIFNLDEVSALILGSIRDTAQEFLGKLVERAVITVPAFYNENQRQAVRRAGELAGLEVERIVNEPTAAALSYGFGRALPDQTLMVYDLGGGTFDASVLELKVGSYHVQATGGDTFLGGVDFDSQLMDHIIIEFQLNLGKLPQMERVAYLRVLQAAEHAKRSLSLVQRTLDTCDAVLAQRSMKPDDVDAILLVGGQTRMPMVRDMIQAHFGKEPLKGVHPDESVATGAALLGHSLDGHVAVDLVDVLPMAIGVGVPGGVMRRIFAANATLPTKRICSIPTHLGKQTILFVPVCQGESTKVDENEKLGLVEVRGIPSGPSGSQTVELTLELDAECLLQVSAKLKGAGQLEDVRLSSYTASAKPESPAVSDKGKSPEPQAAPAPQQDHKPKSGGFFGWIKRLFGR